MDNVVVLPELKSTKSMMLAYAHMAGIDMTMMDSKHKAHAAFSTSGIAPQTVSQLIDDSFGFLV